MPDKKSDCFFVTLQFIHNYETRNNDLLRELKQKEGVINDDPPMLIHGICDMSDGSGFKPHAWIEYGGKVFEASNGNVYFQPTDKFYREFSAKSEGAFDRDDVASLLLADGSVRFWGHYTPEQLVLLRQQYDPSTYDRWHSRDFLQEYADL